MKIVVDGNRGTGKSTLVTSLRSLGFKTYDEGAPSKMVDSAEVAPDDDTCYVILDATAETSLKRMRAAKRRIAFPQIMFAHLLTRRKMFHEVAPRLPLCAMVDADGSREATLTATLEALENFGIRPTQSVC